MNSSMTLKLLLIQLRFHPDITEAIKQIGALLAKQNVEKPQWVAEQLLEGDEELLTRLHGVDLTEAKRLSMLLTRNTKVT